MMRFNAALLLLASALVAQTIPSVGVLQWRSLTSLLDTRDVTSDRNAMLWVGTAGGIYVADPERGTITKQYRPGEGLLGLEFTAIATTESGDTIIAGTSDGIIELLHAQQGPLETLTDIRRAADQYPRRTINDIVVRAGRIYVATDFGIVVYDASGGVPLETVDLVATFAPKSAITALALNRDTLIVAGDQGVAAVWLGTPSLRDRQRWRLWRLPSGWQWDSPARGVTIDVQGSLVVATQTAILRSSGDSLVLVWQRPQGTTEQVRGLGTFNGQVIFAFGQRLWNLDGGNPLGPEQPASVRRVRVVTLPAKMLLTTCLTRGIAVFAQDSLKHLLPNSMLSNSAYDLAVDTRGALWVATAPSGLSGSGFAYLRGNRWSTFAPETDQRVPSPYYYRVAAMPGGDIWLSSWGAGLLRAHYVTDDSITLEQYNNENSPLVGFPANPSYTVPGRTIGDRAGTVWIAHWGNWIQSSSHVIARDSTGRWFGFTFPGNPPGFGYFMHIALDGAGTKWLGSYRTDADGSGLAWFNDGGTLDDPRDDRWGRITTQGTSLPSNTITALVTDRTGMLWVGTTAGLATIVNPTAVLSGNTPFIRTVRELRGVAINAIAVDALNNKWVATSNGIWLISDDGVSIVGTITQPQYPILLSNDVRALASDPVRGLMYVGTERGINVIQTLALQPAQQYEIWLYPQPFDPDHEQLTIEGLAADTELRISTLSGMTIQTIRTRSRTALWDGRSSNGDIVPTGIYLLHAVSEQTGDGAVAKIIVRRSLGSR